MGNLDGKTAIITGGGSGIGRGVAEALAKEGANVALASRSAENLAVAAEAITAAGGKALAMPTDVRHEGEVAALFSKTVETFGSVDIVVNNSGVFTTGPIETMALADWQNCVDVNLTGAFLCSREAFRLMIPQKAGRIINIGSISAKVPRANSTPYTSTKFALEGLSRALALEGREHGIGVSVIQPGNTATAIWEANPEGAAIEGVMPIEEVARVVIAMATMDPKVNLFEAIVLPLSMPYLGRG